MRSRCRRKSRAARTRAARRLRRAVGWAIRAFTPVFDGLWARSAVPTIPSNHGALQVVGFAALSPPYGITLGRVRS